MGKKAVEEGGEDGDGDFRQRDQGDAFGGVREAIFLPRRLEMNQ
jgi:hypothetical protein